MKKVEEKIDRYLTEAGGFTEPQEFSAGLKSTGTPVASPAGAYDPTHDAGSIMQGLKRLKYYMMMANTPTKFQRVFTLAAELATRFPQNNKIAMIFDVFKNTPIKIGKEPGE